MKVIHTALTSKGELVTFKYNGHSTIAVWSDDQYLALLTSAKPNKKSAMAEIELWLASEQARILVEW